MSQHGKDFLPLVFVLVAGALALVAIQRQHISTRPSPQALLVDAADAGHELTRAPMKLARMTYAKDCTRRCAGEGGRRVLASRML